MPTQRDQVRELGVGAKVRVVFENLRNGQVLDYNHLLSNHELDELLFNPGPPPPPDDRMFHLTMMRWDENRSRTTAWCKVLAEKIALDLQKAMISIPTEAA